MDQNGINGNGHILRAECLGMDEVTVLDRAEMLALVNVILEYKLKKGITTPALARLVAKIDAIARRKVGFLAFDTSIKPNPEHQTLGAYLIYLRKQTQLEQQHIAKKCGMGRGTLSQLENDVYKKPLQNATLSRLAIGYGGDIREIQRLARR